MRLNGWQRLWIVIAVPWAICVGLLGYVNWPTADQVEMNAVHARMPPGDTAKLASMEDDRQAVVDVKQLESASRAQDQQPQNTRFTDQQLMEIWNDPRMRDLETKRQALELLTEDERQRLLKLTGPKPPEPALPKYDLSDILEPQHQVVVEGRTLTLTFRAGVSPADVARVQDRCAFAFREELWRNRAAAIRGFGAIWAILLVALYAAGWSLAWVRRGFSNRESAAS